MINSCFKSCANYVRFFSNIDDGYEQEQEIILDAILTAKQASGVFSSLAL